MASPRACGSIASFVCLVVMLMSLVNGANSQTTNNAAGYLLTGLKIGSINSKVSIAGTLINPRQFKLRFEALSALLSLFDLQEKINSVTEGTASDLEGSGSAMVLPDETIEDNSALTVTRDLLEHVIHDSCSFINWTLSDFFYPDYNCEVLTRQSFNCSREAAELLQFQLDLWMANNDAHANLQDFMSSCDDGIRTGCSFVTVGRPKWVNELNLNASDSQEVKVKRYLDCII